MNKYIYKYCVEKLYDDLIDINFNELLNFIVNNFLNTSKEDCNADLIFDYFCDNFETVLDEFDINIDTDAICDFEYFMNNVCNDFHKWLNDNFENWLDNE